MTPEESKQHTVEFYAVRWERLRQLIHDNACHIEDEACCIMANGTASPDEPPTYAQLINTANSRGNRLQFDLNRANDEIKRLKELFEQAGSKIDEVAKEFGMLAAWMLSGGKP